MSLTPKTRLGPYEIVAAIGAGGMGEVYRATDTRLGRTVAVKVLPSHLAADAELRARFEREARAVSSLNHPHICALYDVGEATVSSDPPTATTQVQFFVMEYLEGETLDVRLARGPLPMNQALRVGIETGEALECAHRHGITHRDLKPSNVFLTVAAQPARSAADTTPPGSRRHADDRFIVKLLDFGLAKPHTSAVASTGLGAGQASDDMATGAATPLTGPLTRSGTILGTVHYMAPEQIEGGRADARTDIWALGCLLYEMISGTRPFGGSTPASVIAAILEREPAPLRGDQSAGPPRLWDVIRTCLEKNPDDRWQSTRDLVRELQWSAGELTRSEASPVVPKETSRRAWLLSGAVVLAAAVGVASWAWSRSTDGAAPSGPPVIILMDSTHPERIYDEQTRKAGGTNADDLSDLLRDLPVVLRKENTNATWHREYQVLQENAALIVAHRSSFLDVTMLGEASRQLPFLNLSWDKFEAFAGFIAQGNPRTRVLAYSRGSWRDDTERLQWIASMEQRFPPLRGRLDAMRVPLDRATFRNPTTGAEIRKRIIELLELPANRRD